jgi:ATP:ADP antiporter, AAA family
MSSTNSSGLAPIAKVAAHIKLHERRAVLLAFLCNFMLLGSYYILRPVRDAMATVVGADQLQNLFTGTLIFTMLCAPVFAWLTEHFKLSRVLPGIFWFWIINILIFYGLFQISAESRWVAAAYYWWFSVVNLFMISVFWSLMVDLFAPGQATRLFAIIAAGGSTGAIAGPILTRIFVASVGVDGMLLIAAAGFVVVIALVHLLMHEKVRLQSLHQETQASTLDRKLSGNALDGFATILRSPYLKHQTVFFLLMTWVATVGYFLQTDLITRNFADLESRTRALADIDLVVNICSAVVLIFGLGRFVTRFGVTAGLVLNPVLMVFSFVAMVFSPTVLMMQAMQALRRVSQYAVVRPCREMCFTVVPQDSRYKAKNVIDTVVYRLGDLTSAWLLAGLRMLGFGTSGSLGLGVVASGLWALVSIALGRRYEQLRQQQDGSVSQPTGQ